MLNTLLYSRIIVICMRTIFFLELYYFHITDINECASNPCAHGNCSEGIDTFNCSCSHGYGGLLCDLGKLYGCHKPILTCSQGTHHPYQTHPTPTIAIPTRTLYPNLCHSCYSHHHHLVLYPHPIFHLSFWGRRH